jgi:hypothetical protein
MRGPKKEQQYDGGDNSPPKVFPNYDYIDQNADPKTPSFIASIPSYTGGAFKVFYVAQNESKAAPYKKIGVEVIDADLEKVKQLVQEGKKLIFSTSPGLSKGLNRFGEEVYSKTSSGGKAEGYFTIADPASTYAADRDLDRIKPEYLKGKNFIGIIPA